MTAAVELDKYQGALLGLACGDAVGTSVEFKPRGSFAPVTDMTGGGPFRLQKGQWTDDTAMALCLAQSLVDRRGFNAEDQMQRYCNWYQHGYMSCTGTCFDIGNTVRAALNQFLQTGNPYAGSTDPHSAGNGAIMRLAPVPMFYALDADLTIHFSGESSRTTHAAYEALECARLFGAQIRTALLGGSKSEILLQSGYSPSLPSVQQLANGNYQGKFVTDIQGTGYVFHSLEAALWCFANTDSYAEAILCAVNLGDDADTTAAIVGQIAGAFYGVAGIPSAWLTALAEKELIMGLASELLLRRFNPLHK